MESPTGNVWPVLIFAVCAENIYEIKVKYKKIDNFFISIKLKFDFLN